MDNNKRFAYIAIAAIVLALVFSVYAGPAMLLVATGDYPGSSQFYGLQEDHWIVSVLIDLAHTLGNSVAVYEVDAAYPECWEVDPYYDDIPLSLVPDYIWAMAGDDTIHHFRCGIVDGNFLVLDEVLNEYMPAYGYNQGHWSFYWLSYETLGEVYLPIINK